MRNKWHQAAVATALLMTPAAGEAKDVTILARCGASDGQSYYFEGGFVGPGQGGWKKDGVDDGRVTVFLNENDQLDLLVKDRATTRSYLKAGYKVGLINFDQATKTMLISAYGSDFSETYLIRQDDAGIGTMVWTISKITPAIAKSSTMQAPCGPQYAIKP